VAPKLNVVQVSLLADTKDPDELMLAPIERALAGIRLDPDNQVQRLVVNCSTGFKQLAGMAPIHAHVVHGAIARNPRSCRQRLLEKRDELRTRELTRSHGEFRVLDLTATDDVAHTDVIGRIEKRHGSAGQRPSPAPGPGLCERHHTRCDGDRVPRDRPSC
jgi:hypothetical protein